MPSSLIVVALVAAWLVVLVPMVAKHRQQVRRVGGPAMSTRVLHRGDRVVTPVRRGPAAGHRSDPDWRPEAVEDELDPADTADDRHDELLEDPVDDRDDRHDEHDRDDHDERGPDHDEYDRDEHDRRDVRLAEHPPRRRGRGGFDPEADAVARHARYATRQRVVLALVGTAVVSGVLAATLLPVLGWLTLVAALSLVGYLVYLRAQVRIEQEVRERRLNRMGRARLGVPTAEHDLAAEAPQRLRRPGAVVLEVDDEDPAFHDLDEYAPVAEHELRRATG